MPDNKKYYRNLKKEVKKAGNRKRRHFLKDLNAEPDNFDFGSNQSSALNGIDGIRKNKNELPNL